MQTFTYHCHEILRILRVYGILIEQGALKSLNNVDRALFSCFRMINEHSNSMNNE